MTASVTDDPSRHGFVTRPHGTVLALSLPILVSLVAEPLTGLVDTAFVARLGDGPAAALGVGTVVLSSVMWVFNFLSIGCQTEVARSYGEGRVVRAREASGLALLLSLGFGVLLLGVGLLAVRPVAAWMGAVRTTLDDATTYLTIRLLAVPAILIMQTAFGALRGLQDVKTPLRIAVATNAANVVLDALLIPVHGIAGAAWATAFSQAAGCVWAVLAVQRRLGLPRGVHSRDAHALLAVGADLFLRTGLLLLFILLATRRATRGGDASGAAHQAIRQVWTFAALLLDAFALTAQSLVGYFLGAGAPLLARRVAWVACLHGFAAGLFLLGVMLGLESWIRDLLVPVTAATVFGHAWWVSAIAQPFNAVSFVTDGIHWGTRDYRYLRNAMITATVAGAVGLALIDEKSETALATIWLVTGGWIVVRAVLGVVRVWPGIGRAPLRRSALDRPHPGASGGRPEA